jgi:parallel beta-helix repeat protein
MIDIYDSKIAVRDNNLHCDSFLLPPELANGATDLPSSLGCVVALQGIGAAVGYPHNVQWLRLAGDPVAHAAHPEAGPLGTWRPQGPAAAQQKSRLRIVDNSCQSSESSNTYCFHVFDANYLAFGLASVNAVLIDNECEGSQTCIGLEHINEAIVRRNECSSQAYGIELHNSFNNLVVGNSFDFPAGTSGCEIRTLMLGEKIDFSRVVPGAGICAPQA